MVQIYFFFQASPPSLRASLSRLAAGVSLRWWCGTRAALNHPVGQDGTSARYLHAYEGKGVAPPRPSPPRPAPPRPNRPRAAPGRLLSTKQTAFFCCRSHAAAEVSDSGGKEGCAERMGAGPRGTYPEKMDWWKNLFAQHLTARLLACGAHTTTHTHTRVFWHV